MRGQSNQQPIRSMAVAVGRKKQYDLPYSIAASIHHGDFEALCSHLTASANDAFMVEELPSMKWVMQAFVSGQVYLSQALETLNVCLQLGFERRLDDMCARLQTVWKSS